MGGRWRYKLTYSVSKVYKVYTTKMHKNMGGRWRYNLIVSLKYIYIYIYISICIYIYICNYTLQRDTNYGCTLALQTYRVSTEYTKLMHYKDTETMGRPWRCKLIVSLKYKVCTLQRYRNYGSTLALHTYSVSKVYKVYTTKIQKLWVDAGVTNV